MQLRLFKDELQNDLAKQARQWLDTLEYLDSLPSPLECEAIIAWEHLLSMETNRFCRASASVCLN